MATLEQFKGCLLGLALGDALGAPYEGGVVERLLWRVIGGTRSGERRWTDDTQMTVDLIESFLSRGTIDPDDLAIRFANSYRWSRGYGPAAAKLLKRIRRGADWRQANRSTYAGGSFGNGGAMRAPILGLMHAGQADNAIDAARLTASVTHAHEIGVEGAVLLAMATERVATGCDAQEIVPHAIRHCALDVFLKRLHIARAWLESDEAVAAAEVARQLGHGIAAHESCVTAVYLALRFRRQPFLEMLQFATQVGGDVDTIGAMAGALWGAANGFDQLPPRELATLEQRERLIDLAARLYQKVSEDSQPA